MHSGRTLLSNSMATRATSYKIPKSHRYFLDSPSNLPIYPIRAAVTNAPTRLGPRPAVNANDLSRYSSKSMEGSYSRRHLQIHPLIRPRVRSETSEVSNHRTKRRDVKYLGGIHRSKPSTSPCDPPPSNMGSISLGVPKLTRESTQPGPSASSP